MHTAMDPPVQERKTSSFMISDILDSTSSRKPKHLLTIPTVPEHFIPHVDEHEHTTHSPLSAGDIGDKEPGDSPLGESDYSQSSQGSEGMCFIFMYANIVFVNSF